MDDDSNPNKKRRTIKKDLEASIGQVTALATAAGAVESTQPFGPQPLMGERKENFIPGHNPHFQDNNLVASNPFDDRPPQSFEMPARPPPLPPPRSRPFVQTNPMPRSGFTPDQIGNMSYMSYMQRPNPMAYPPNPFEHPPIGAANPMYMRPVNNAPFRQIDNANNANRDANNPRMHRNPNRNQTMNTRMGGASTSGHCMVHRPSKNSVVGGLAMSGSSTLINPIAGSINDPRASPVNQVMNIPNLRPLMGSPDRTQNRVSPVTPVMNIPNLRPLMASPDRTQNRVSPVTPVMNIPNLKPLMSPNHMQSAMSMPPMDSMNSAYPQQHSNQMNNPPGPMQGPPSMPMPGMNPAVPASMMGSNNQVNNRNMSSPYDGAPDMNMPRPYYGAPDMNMSRPYDGAPDMNMPRPYDGAPDMNMPRPYDGAPGMNMSRPYDGAPDMNMPRPYYGAPDMNMSRPYDGAPDMNMPRPYDGAPDMNMPRPYDGAPGMNMSRPYEGAPDMNMSRPYDGAPDMNMMNGNQRHSMPFTAQHNGQNTETTEQVMGGTVQNLTSGNLAGLDANMGMPTFQPDLQGMMNPKPMIGMPVGSKARIYPSNQLMVFDHHNPHAPPIVPCRICCKEVQAADQAIFCESGCNFWFHRQCAGLNEKAHQFLINEPYADWICDKCLVSKNIPLVKFKL